MGAETPARAEWLTKQEAAKFLKVSIRQVERREAAGYLEKRVGERGPMDRAGAVLYSRADLEALKAGKPNIHAREVREEAANPKPIRDAENAVALRGQEPNSGQIARVTSSEVLKSLAELITAARSGPPLEPKPWMTLAEAVEYSGLPASWLLARARDGVKWAIDVGQGGARQFWRFNREGLKTV